MRTIVSIDSMADDDVLPLAMTRFKGMYQSTGSRDFDCNHKLNQHPLHVFTLTNGREPAEVKREQVEVREQDVV